MPVRKWRVYKLRQVKGKAWRARYYDSFGNPYPETYRNRFWKWEHAMAFVNENGLT